jgi:hypothetical protein
MQQEYFSRALDGPSNLYNYLKMTVDDNGVGCIEEINGMKSAKGTASRPAMVSKTLVLLIEIGSL